jgi:hypothetical protein
MTVFKWSIKQRNMLGKTWELLCTFFAGKWTGGHYASGRSCERSALVFLCLQANSEMLQVASCYCALLMQLSQFKFNNYPFTREATELFLFPKYSSENKIFSYFCLKIQFLIALTSLLTHYPYQKEELENPGNLLK